MYRIVKYIIIQFEKNFNFIILFLLASLSSVINIHYKRKRTICLLSVLLGHIQTAEKFFSVFFQLFFNNFQHKSRKLVTTHFSNNPRLIIVSLSKVFDSAELKITILIRTQPRLICTKDRSYPVKPFEGHKYRVSFLFWSKRTFSGICEDKCTILGG